jgi:hypothetical protein
MRNKVFLTSAYVLSLISDPAIAVKEIKRSVKFSLDAASRYRDRSVPKSRNTEGARLNASTVLRNDSNNILPPRENGITYIKLARANTPANAGALN